MSLIDAIKKYSENLVLSPKKKEKLNSFLDKGFPTTKDEEWKYTSLKKIIKQDYFIASAGVKIDKKEISKHSLGFSKKIVFVDGLLVSQPNFVGLKIDSYSEFENNDFDEILKLNYALASQGYTISVDENTIIEDPIEVLFLNTVESGFIQYRNLLNIGKNSQVKFVEKIQNVKCNTSLTISSTQVNCEKNVHIEYNKIQNNTSKSRVRPQHICLHGI